MNSWIFDCDGVLLNSNSLKSEAMFEAAVQYGTSEATALITYHEQRGGIGREKKFKYFFEKILGRNNNYADELADLSQRYADGVKEKLANCDVANNLFPLLAHLRGLNIELIVSSGAEQTELQEVLHDKGLSQHFSRILGSPRSKEDHIESLKAEGYEPSVFIGDSQYDCSVAKHFNLHCYFLYGWTDYKKWQEYLVDQTGITIKKDISDLYEYILSAEAHLP